MTAQRTLAVLVLVVAAIACTVLTVAALVNGDDMQITVLLVLVALSCGLLSFSVRAGAKLAGHRG